MHFPELIKETRKKLMFSQQEFAEELGVSFGTINRWENNKCKPNYKDQRRVAEYLKRHGIGENFI